MSSSHRTWDRSELEVGLILQELSQSCPQLASQFEASALDHTNTDHTPEISEIDEEGLGDEEDNLFFSEDERSDSSPNKPSVPVVEAPVIYPRPVRKRTKISAARPDPNVTIWIPLQLSTPSPTKNPSPNPPERFHAIFNDVGEGRARNKAMNLACHLNESFFVTGPAASGKTSLLKAMYDRFSRKGKERRKVFKIAPTNGTALACGGQTIHAFAGINPGARLTTEVIDGARRNAQVQYRWRMAEVLLIDEVSQIESKTFNLLDEMARLFRKRNEPFGGIQVVCFGDFLTLPPVATNNPSPYAFQSKAWKSIIKQTVTIKYREGFSPRGFGSVLDEIRLGHMCDESIAIIQSLERPLPPMDPPPIKLFARVMDVDEANAAELSHLPGPLQSFAARDDNASNYPTGELIKWLESCPAPKILQLRVNAPVMLLLSKGPDLPSGSIGRFIGVATHQIWSQIKRVCRTVKDAPTLILVGKGVHEKFGAGPVRWPIVHFSTPTKQIYALITLQEWRSELGKKGACWATRTQIPLRLAWATTIHRSQGVTYPSARVDLSHAFECGHVYVALSRVRCTDNLEVIGFNPRKVVADHEALEFYETVYETEERMREKKPPQAAL